MVKELLNFLRTGISLSIVFLAASGYLIFNSPGQDIIFVILGSFFLSCGAYGYNAITDKEEDTVNRRVNSLAFSKLGADVVFFCFIFGLLMSSFLGAVSFWISISIILSAVVYSRFRLKKYTYIKNIYTALSVSQSFLLGAMTLSFDILLYYLSISLFLFIGSVISDLRDYYGDKELGIITLPVRFGIEKTKKMIYLLLALAFFLFFAENTRKFFPLLISIPLLGVFTFKNKPHLAHLSGGFSFLFLVLWLVGGM